jgi:hypothetical protein
MSKPSRKDLASRAPHRSGESADVDRVERQVADAKADRKANRVVQPPASRRSTLDSPPDIGDKRRTDPRLRPFIVAMANAIIKDMLRERKEETR